MESLFNGAAIVFANLYGVVGLVCVGIGIYWVFNKKAKKRQLAVLRKRLDELQPSDPEYNQVRALYASMMLAAASHSVYSEGGGADNMHHSDNGGHGGSDFSGGGSDSD